MNRRTKETQSNAGINSALQGEVTLLLKRISVTENRSIICY